MMIETLSASSGGGSHFSSGLLYRSSSTYPLFLATDSSSYVDSTPNSTIDYTETSNDDTDFLPFDGPDYPDRHEDLEPPPPPISVSNDSERAMDPEGDAVSEHFRPEYPKVQLRDDNMIEDEPTKHVDYLSHDWKEEDIWSSWRYIISRRGKFNNSIRLEYASWRIWTSVKYRLRKVSPERLNWYDSPFMTLHMFY
jgi:hypothetical protein